MVPSLPGESGPGIRIDDEDPPPDNLGELSPHVKDVSNGELVR
jgi:hypothetical protein